VFPADGLPSDLGLCRDQNVIYVPQINRFLWLMLTSGSVAGYRAGTNSKPDKTQPKYRLFGRTSDVAGTQ